MFGNKSMEFFLLPGKFVSSFALLVHLCVCDGHTYISVCIFEEVRHEEEAWPCSGSYLDTGENCL